MTKLVTFDVVNTILKVRSSAATQYARAAQKSGLNVSEQQVHAVYTQTWRKYKQQYPLYGMQQGITEEEFWRTFVHRIFNQVEPNIQTSRVDQIADTLLNDFDKDPNMWEFLPNATPVLDKIKSQGIKLGVISNFDNRLKRTLRNQNVGEYFDFTVTCMDAVSEKPDPRIFEHALKMAGCDASEAVHIGDDVIRDYFGARRVGMGAILFDSERKLSGPEVMDIPPKYDDMISASSSDHRELSTQCVQGRIFAKYSRCLHQISKHLQDKIYQIREHMSAKQALLTPLNSSLNFRSNISHQATMSSSGYKLLNGFSNMVGFSGGILNQRLGSYVFSPVRCMHSSVNAINMRTSFSGNFAHSKNDNVHTVSKLSNNTTNCGSSINPLFRDIFSQSKPNSRSFCSKSPLIDSSIRHISNTSAVATTAKSSKKDKRKNLREENKDRVVGYGISDRIDLRGLQEFLRQDNLYVMMPMPRDADDVLAVKAFYTPDHQERHIFFFKDGGVVFWDMPESERLPLLKSIKHLEGKYEDHVVMHESDSLTYTETSEATRFDGCDVLLRTPGSVEEAQESILEKYTISKALILSVKLDCVEYYQDRIADSVEEMNRRIQHHAILFRKGQIFVRIAELIHLKHYVNCRSDLLDTPDFFWDRDHLEEIFHQGRAEFDLQKRTQVLIKRLEHCSELLDNLKAQVIDQKHLRVEYLIVALIAVEVFLELIHQGYINFDREAKEPKEDTGVFFKVPVSVPQDNTQDQ